MPTLKQITGYDVESGWFDDKGREYLASATNPGSMLIVDRVLIVKSDNTTLLADEIETLTLAIKEAIKISMSKPIDLVSHEVKP